MISRASESTNAGTADETRRIDFLVGISNMTIPGLMAVESGFANLTAAGMRASNVLNSEMSILGAGAMAAGGAAVLALGLMTAKAVEYEREMKTVQSLIENTGDSASSTQKTMEQLSSAAKGLSLEYGIDPTEIAQGFEVLGRAGVEGANAINQVEDAAVKLGKIENIDTKTASTEIVNLVSLFGGDYAKDAEQFATILAHAANISTTSAPQIMEAFKYVGGVATSIWGNKDIYENATEMAAGVAALSQQGLQGANAGTALRSFFQYVSAPQAKSKNALTSIGMKPEDMFTTDENGQPILKSFPEIMNTFQEAFAKKGMNDTEIYQFFQKWGQPKMAQQYQKLFTETTEAGADGKTKVVTMYQKYLDQMHEEYDMQQKVNTIMSSTSEQVNKLKAAVEVMGVNIGENVLPVLSILAQVFTAIGDAMTKIPGLSTAISASLMGLIALGGIAVLKWFKPIASELFDPVRKLASGDVKEALSLEKGETTEEAILRQVTAFNEGIAANNQLATSATTAATAMDIETASAERVSAAVAGTYVETKKYAGEVENWARNYSPIVTPSNIDNLPEGYRQALADREVFNNSPLFTGANYEEAVRRATQPINQYGVRASERGAAGMLNAPLIPSSYISEEEKALQQIQTAAAHTNNTIDILENTQRREEEFLKKRQVLSSNFTMYPVNSALAGERFDVWTGSEQGVPLTNLEKNRASTESEVKQLAEGITPAMAYNKYLENEDEVLRSQMSRVEKLKADKETFGNALRNYFDYKGWSGKVSGGAKAVGKKVGSAAYGGLTDLLGLLGLSPELAVGLLAAGVAGYEVYSYGNDPSRMWWSNPNEKINAGLAQTKKYMNDIQSQKSSLITKENDLKKSYDGGNESLKGQLDTTQQQINALDSQYNATEQYYNSVVGWQTNMNNKFSALAGLQNSIQVSEAEQPVSGPSTKTSKPGTGITTIGQREQTDLYGQMLKRGELYQQDYYAIMQTQNKTPMGNYLNTAKGASQLSAYSESAQKMQEDIALSHGYEFKNGKLEPLSGTDKIVGFLKGFYGGPLDYFNMWYEKSMMDSGVHLQQKGLLDPYGNQKKGLSALHIDKIEINGTNLSPNQLSASIQNALQKFASFMNGDQTTSTSTATGTSKVPTSSNITNTNVLTSGKL